uniref:Uncharacterized protein n=1 Tax=Cacopsylla melanoneura TaxID=428564 RepID=A0A8D9BHF9_9HEMI
MCIISSFIFPPFLFYITYPSCFLPSFLPFSPFAPNIPLIPLFPSSALLLCTLFPLSWLKNTSALEFKVIYRVHGEHSIFNGPSVENQIQYTVLIPFVSATCDFF